MANTMPVFTVIRLVRDARSTRNADRALLLALAMRCQPAKKFISWPSYRQLELDTMLDAVTLKRAAKRLEDAGLIKRIIRQNRSNAFFLNVPLLQQQAVAVKEAEEADKRKTQFSDDEDSPFALPDIAAEDGDTGDDWMTGGAQ